MWQEMVCFFSAFPCAHNVLFQAGAIGEQGKNFAAVFQTLQERFLRDGFVKQVKQDLLIQLCNGTLGRAAVRHRSFERKFRGEAPPFHCAA